MRSISRHAAILIACAATTITPACSHAEDVFYEIPGSQLKLSGGKIPEQDIAINVWQARLHPMAARVQLDGPGEGYCSRELELLAANRQRQELVLVIRAPQGQAVSGRLFMPKADFSGMQQFKFEVPASAASKIAAKAFFMTKQAHYQSLLDRDIPGAAWFRHELDGARDKLAETGNARPGDTPQRPLLPGPPTTYDLFSGGRAVSENLQLDRPLRGAPAPAQPDVKIDSLEGITVAEIDWKPLLKDANPRLDPLARLIPADQHVLFFSSLDAVFKVADESKGGETQLFRLAEPRSEDLGIQVRYERQIGLSLGLGRLLGPAVIRSVAVTGSDPYFPTGTDVAILFQADQPKVLATLLLGQIHGVAVRYSDFVPEKGTVGNLAYEGFRSPARRVCSYVATLDGAVVVTNSLAQLDRLARVGKDLKSIDSLDEFKFFRQRYPLGDKDETAFLFLSDATIRRWCGPRWRIASARRTQAAAVLAELTAENLTALGSAKVEPKVLHTDLPLVDAGELKLTNAGVTSSTYGSLGWLTPIVELPIERVTKAEADGYNQWRTQYQQYWRWAFDPIGLRLGVLKEKLAADLTVMPLIAGTDYARFIAISRGAKIGANDGDRHNTLASFILALNTKSELFQQAGNSLSSLSPQIKTDPLGWLGSSISVYVDDDPVWKELTAMTPEQRKKLINAPGRIPVGVQIAVSNPLKLTAFLVAFRAFVEQTAPGMVTWESLTHRDQPYVRIKPTDQARNVLRETDLSIYYAPSAQGLILTLNEGVLRRAIERRIDGANAKKNGQGTGSKESTQSVDVMPWLGENFCLQVDRRLFDLLIKGNLFDVLDAHGESPLQALMQAQAWGNLPILNEWKRLFPDLDPVMVHERLWHAKLLSPNGGSYVWNDEWKTMESTVYGHPGQPKKGPAFPAGLARMKAANFGLTFEDKGLRARMELLRETK